MNLLISFFNHLILICKFTINLYIIFIATVLLNSSFCFTRQCLIKPRMALNWWCRRSWTWTLEHPTSASWVLTCTITPNWKFQFLILVALLRFSEMFCVNDHVTHKEGRSTSFNNLYIVFFLTLLQYLRSLVWSGTVTDLNGFLKLTYCNEGRFFF